MLVMLGCSLASCKKVKSEPADAGDARLLAGSLKILQNGEPQPTDANHARLSSN